MRLSVETYIISKKFGDEKAIEMIKEAGFDCIDYSFYWFKEDLREKALGKNYMQYARMIKSCLERSGISCNQAHAPFELSFDNRLDVSDERYAELVRSLEFAAELGAQNIVVHAISVPSDVDYEEYNFRFYKGLEPFCSKFGIRVAIENLFGFDAKRKYHVGKFGTPEALGGIVKRLDSEWFTACVDIGHAAITGTEPEDFIRGMGGELLGALHVHDNDYLYDRHTLPYIGNFDWDKVTSALADIDYKGDLTLEIFNFLRGFDDELIPYVLKLCAETGRHLIRKIEKAK